MNNPSENSCLEIHLGYSDVLFNTPVASEVIELGQGPITYLEQADNIKRIHSFWTCYW